MRKVEIFSAGCALCTDTIALVRGLACASCEVTVHDVHQPAGMTRARELGVRSVPAVAVNGRLAECCAVRGVNAETLRAAGIGQPA